MNFNGGYLAYWGAGLAERYAEAIGRWASEQSGIPYIPALTTWGAHIVSNTLLNKYRDLVYQMSKLSPPMVKGVDPLDASRIYYADPKKAVDISDEFFTGVVDKLNFKDTKAILHNVFSDNLMLSNKYFIKVIGTHYYNALNDTDNNNQPIARDSDLNILLTFLANSVTMPSVKSSNSKFTRFNQDIYIPNNISTDGSLVITYYSDLRNKFDLLIRDIMLEKRFTNADRLRYDLSITTYQNTQSYSGDKIKSDPVKQILFCSETIFTDISLDNIQNYTLSSDTAFLTKTVSFNYNDSYDILYSDRFGKDNIEKFVYYMYKGFAEALSNIEHIDFSTANKETEET